MTEYPTLFEWAGGLPAFDRLAEVSGGPPA